MQQNHRIISIQHNTLITQRRKIENPVFYDDQTNLAKQCSFADKMYHNYSMIEDPDLLNNIKQKLIFEDTLNHNNNNFDGNLPVTPDSSDVEDNVNNNHYPSFGQIKDTKITSITELTQKLELLNEDGINTLDNNDNQTKDFGIYNENDIYKQVIRFDKNKYLNGEDLINMNEMKQFKTNKKKKRRKRQKQQHSVSPQINMNGNKKRLKRRRGGRKNKKPNHRNDNNDNDKNENENNRHRNEDEIECGKLVGYIKNIRTQTFES